MMIARAVFASADRLLSAKSPNLHLHLLLKLTREVGAAIAVPEPPESIVALGRERPTKFAGAARQLVKP